jgi:hypothetical protein
VSEKSIPQQQAGLGRRAKTSRRNPADLAGACSGGKFVVSRAGEAYDAQAGNPNRRFRIIGFAGRLSGYSLADRLRGKVREQGGGR